MNQGWLPTKKPSGIRAAKNAVVPESLIEPIDLNPVEPVIPNFEMAAPMLDFSQDPADKFRLKFQGDKFRDEDRRIAAETELQSRAMARQRKLQADLERSELEVAGLEAEYTGMANAIERPQYRPAEHSMGSVVSMLAGLVSGRPDQGMAAAEGYREQKGKERYQSAAEEYNQAETLRQQQLAAIKMNLEAAYKRRAAGEEEIANWEELVLKEEAQTGRNRETIQGRVDVAGDNNNTKLGIADANNATKIRVEEMKGKNAERKLEREMKYKYDTLKSLDAYRQASIKLGEKRVDQIAQNAVIAANTRIQTTGMVVSGHDRRQIVAQEFERGLRESGLLVSPAAYRLTPEQQIVSNEMNKVHATIGQLEEALTEAMAIDDQDQVLDIAKRLEAQKKHLGTLQEKFSRPLPAPPAGGKEEYPNDKRPSKPG